MKTQVIITQQDDHTAVHVDHHSNQATASMFLEAALKNDKIMSGCWYVVLAILREENPEAYRTLRIAHSGIHPSRMIKEARGKARQHMTIAL